MKKKNIIINCNGFNYKCNHGTGAETIINVLDALNKQVTIKELQLDILNNKKKVN